MTDNKATLYYVHDPMCGWCWGYKPTFEKLCAELPTDIDLQYLVGGLAPDNDEPMPQDMREAIQGYWHKIQGLLGTEFNFDFWTKCEPRRSTYPACRSVLAAKQQHQEVEMIEAIQYAYYLKAMNPSNIETHHQLALELGLDAEQFEKDLKSVEIEHLFQAQMQKARGMPIHGFPSLVLELSGEYHGIPLDYKSAAHSLEVINELV